MKEKHKNSSTFIERIFKEMSKNTYPSVELTEEDRIKLDYYLEFVKSYPDILLVFSLNGQIISRNEKLIHNLLGYTFHKNLNSEDIISKDTYETLLKTFNKAKKGATKRLKIHVNHKNDKELSLTLTFVPIKAKHNSIEDVSLVIEDMTSQGELERSYQLKDKHLGSAQQVANIGSWKYNVATDQLDGSDTFYKIIGLNSQEYLSLNEFLSFIDRDDFNKVSELINKAIKNGFGYGVNFTVQRKLTGEVRYVQEYVETVKENHQVTHLIGVIKDVTEYK